MVISFGVREPLVLILFSKFCFSVRHLAKEIFLPDGFLPKYFPCLHSSEELNNIMPAKIILPDIVGLSVKVMAISHLLCHLIR